MARLVSQLASQDLTVEKFATELRPDHSKSLKNHRATARQLTEVLATKVGESLAEDLHYCMPMDQQVKMVNLFAAALGRTKQLDSDQMRLYEGLQRMCIRFSPEH